MNVVQCHEDSQERREKCKLIYSFEKGNRFLAEIRAISEILSNRVYLYFESLYFVRALYGVWSL